MNSRVHFVAAVAAELGDLPGTALGVGLVAAGVSAGRLLARERPAAVVLVGTAGSFGPAPGPVVAGAVVGLGSAASALGLGYVPLAPGPIAGDPSLLAAAQLPPARVLTNLAITADPGLAAQFGRDWQIEHMEAYAVAHACAEAGVPFLAILGVSNAVGPNAHAEWKLNRGEAERAARTAAAALAAGWLREG